MAAGDTQITMAGNLVDDPELRFTPAGQPVARFRVASTPRYLDKNTNEWKDGDSLFLTCNVWRQAAENVAESLTRGTRVIVSGRLRQRSYETKEGEKRTVYEVEVDDVGPSLRNASAKVNRVARNGSGGSGGSAGPGGSGGRAASPGGSAAGPPAVRAVQAARTPIRGRPTVPAATPTNLRSRRRMVPGRPRTAGVGVRRTPAAFFDPGRYGLLVGPGLAAQLRGGPGERLVEFSLRRALEDPGHFGQQVSPASRERTEFGERDGFLVLGERAPLRVMPGLAGELRHQDSVGRRSQSMIPHRHSVADLRRYRQKVGETPSACPRPSSARTASGFQVDATITGPRWCCRTQVRRVAHRASQPFQLLLGNIITCGQRCAWVGSGSPRTRRPRGRRGLKPQVA